MYALEIKTKKESSPETWPWSNGLKNLRELLKIRLLVGLIKSELSKPHPCLGVFEKILSFPKEKLLQYLYSKVNMRKYHLREEKVSRFHHSCCCGNPISFCMIIYPRRKNFVDQRLFDPCKKATKF